MLFIHKLVEWRLKIILKGLILRRPLERGQTGTSHLTMSRMEAKDNTEGAPLGILWNGQSILLILRWVEERSKTVMKGRPFWDPSVESARIPTTIKKIYNSGQNYWKNYKKLLIKSIPMIGKIWQCTNGIAKSYCRGFDECWYKQIYTNSFKWSPL